MENNLDEKGIQFEKFVTDFMLKNHPEIWNLFRNQVSFPKIFHAGIIFNDSIILSYDNFKKIMNELYNKYDTFIN